MAPTKSTLISLLTLTSQANAWGTLGHDTVAYIAQSFLTTEAATFAKDLLKDTSTAYLANVATWADTYRYTAEGTFSAPLHYIDALDSPPTSCNIDYDRDCPEEGCIVSAIANYTTRVQNTKLSTTERQKALKWVVHFLGDIHQPLHVENLAVGGNSIDVTFNGTSTNLHHIWDSNMAEKLIGGYSLSDAEAWSKTLVTAIKTGKYASQKAGWLTGLNVNDGKSSALIWATDANSFVCTTVIPKGQAAVTNKELQGAYYDAAIPVIQIQIAKAGYRLAAWLNAIVTGSTGLENTTYSKNKMAVVGAYAKREEGEKREVELEDWMVEARRVRRAFGWNCGAEGHRH